MNKSIFIIFISFINVCLFVVGLSYNGMIDSSINLFDGLIEHINFVNIAICAGLLLVPYVSITSKQEKIQTIQTPKTISFEENIKNLLYSPAPLNTRLRKALEVTINSQSLDAAYVFIYEKDALKILVQNGNTEKFNINEIIKPHKENMGNNPIENFLSNFYLEKREQTQKTQTLDNSIYHFKAIALKDNQHNSGFGLILYISNNEFLEAKKYQLDYLAYVASFAIGIVLKKDEVYKKSVSEIDSNVEINKKTGIYINTKIQKIINQEMKRHQRYKTELTLVLFQIDHFKNLCNIFDAKTTDAILQDFIHTIKSNIRETDIFGHWSEEKYALVLSDLGFQAGSNASKRIQDILNEKHFKHVGKITCSFGVTSYSTRDTPASFRIRAENALETAKAQGVNKIETKLLM